MSTVPRVGEFMKFKNAVEGDYFAFKVTEVTYREGGPIEVWTELLDNVDNRMYSFEDEAEFDECFSSYLAEGWQCPRGAGPNHRFQPNIHWCCFCGRPAQDLVTICVYLADGVRGGPMASAHFDCLDSNAPWLSVKDLEEFAE